MGTHGVDKNTQAPTPSSRQKHKQGK